jgi:hypothetical protein
MSRALPPLGFLLAACAAAVPAQTDSGGFVLPPLTRSMTVTLHVETPGDFEAALDAHGIAIAHAFAVLPMSSSSHICEIFIRASDVRPENWRTLGSTLHHELAHCEGWPADHPTGWRPS